MRNLDGHAHLWSSLDWKAQQLYKAVSVKAGLFKSLKHFYTKQKWGSQYIKWLLWKLIVLRAQIF